MKGWMDECEVSSMACTVVVAVRTAMHWYVFFIRDAGPVV